MKREFCIAVIFVLVMFAAVVAVAVDLGEIKDKGVIRHVGVPYARFFNTEGKGLDAEIVRLYAEKIGVRYEYVPTTWSNMIGDLSGVRVSARGEEVDFHGTTLVKGDIIGCGLTVIPWRAKVINYSRPHFPTGVWLIARVDSKLRPIKPTGSLKQDVELTKAFLVGKEAITIKNTCLDAALSSIPGAKPKYVEMNLNQLAPAVIKGECEATVLDVPDALVALRKYPGKIKVIGPITENQDLAFGVSKDSPELLKSFNEFLDELTKSGKLEKLIVEYYPDIQDYFPNAGKWCSEGDSDLAAADSPMSEDIRPKGN